jgi:hypothetical protein
MNTHESQTKILVYDFGCHDFILSLAKGLSTRYYSVLHLYSEDYSEGKKISDATNEINSFDSKGIHIWNIPSNKNIFRRLSYELLFAFKTLKQISKFQPDLIIIGTSPLLVSVLICRKYKKTPKVYWHQDCYALGIETGLQFRLPLLNFIVSRLAFNLEKNSLAQSDAIVSIGKNFSTIYERMKIHKSKITYLENWATCEHPFEYEMNSSIDTKFGYNRARINLIYAGALGLKHLPNLIIDLYNKLSEKSDCRLTILTSTDAKLHLSKLLPPNSGIEILNYKPKADFCGILSQFDFGLTVLSEDASLYSVPSKILTYAAHNLALVSLVPKDNPSAEITLRAGGILSDPTVEGAQKVADALAEITREGINDLKQASYHFSRKSSTKQNKVELFERIIKSILD